MVNSLKFAEIILNIAQKSNLNRILSISDLAFYKFCVGVSNKHLIKNIKKPDDNTNFNTIYNTALRPSAFDKISILFRLCYALIRSHFEYFIFVLPSIAKNLRFKFSI